jgi:hypothetical protein
VRFECGKCHTVWEFKLQGQLARLDRELSQREQALVAREATLRLREDGHRKEVQFPSTFVSNQIRRVGTLSVVCS